MELTGVDLNLLVAFDALMEERSVTRAASRLSLSQPGMSNTLARLRKLFDDPLLVRQGLRLVPTPRADALRQPVRDALALISGALDQRTGFDPAADPATWTVSCSDYSLLMLIGPLVRRLAATAPGVTIRVLPRAPDPIRLLRDGAADLVIEPAEIMPEAQLASRRLFGDRWLCCVWEGNAAVGDQITLDAYLRLGHLEWRASCWRRSCSKAPTWSPSCQSAPFRTCGAPPPSGCSSRRCPCPRSPRCCGGTHGTPPTPPTRGSAPRSPRSRPSSTSGYRARPLAG